MRIFIFILFYCSCVCAKEVNWQALESEMQYLKENAFIDKKEVSPKEKQKPISKNLSLKRPQTRQSPLKDKEIMPLEEKFFDQVDFKMAAPKRSSSKKEKKIKQRKRPRLDGGVPEDLDL